MPELAELSELAELAEERVSVTDPGDRPTLAEPVTTGCPAEPSPPEVVNAHTG
ncbi:MAG TPA: hypothetical protein VFD59_11570 [Nocardioidaceae bacterium]|nr:hypothetical protein [Nocardioidaceae bacterium]